MKVPAPLQKAMEWLDEQDGKQPFFGVLTYTLPHAELVQPEDSILNEYKEKFNPDKSYKGSEGSRYNAITHVHAQFAGMITRLDYYVGEVLKKLKEKGLDENTLVIFSSDNGPHEEGGADPTFFGRDGKLRGLKRQCYEGGIRIPFIARWPGRVPAGTVKKGIPFLYNLATDIHEDNNVADQHPEIVEKMKAVIFAQHTPNPHFSVTLPEKK